MKHTQGEWTVSRISATTVEVKGSNRSIASTGGYQTNGAEWDTVIAENEANALLIAAAPDLLEALDTAVQYIDAKRYPELMQMCEAAISKAKGK